MAAYALVNRRVGGLEDGQRNILKGLNVNRRVGGLEARMRRAPWIQFVNRRVGGLEVVERGTHDHQ